MRSVGIETSNLYSAFVWLALELLEDGGELVAITPRSFMNGAYFRPFRRALTGKFAFRRIHVYDFRDAAFAGEAVLQENVIFHGIHQGTRGRVRITTSYGPFDEGLAERTVDQSELVLPDDPACVLHVVPDGIDARIAEQMRALPRTLADHGVGVSTGRVGGFRAQDRLRAEAAAGDAPFIMPRQFAQGFVAWPKAAGSKPKRLDGIWSLRRTPAASGLVRLGPSLQREGRKAPRGRCGIRSGARGRGSGCVRQQAECAARRQRRPARETGQGARGFPEQHGRGRVLPAVQRTHPGQCRGSTVLALSGRRGPRVPRPPRRSTRMVRCRMS